MKACFPFLTPHSPLPTNWQQLKNSLSRRWKISKRGNPWLETMIPASSIHPAVCTNVDTIGLSLWEAHPSGSSSHYTATLQTLVRDTVLLQQLDHPQLHVEPAGQAEGRHQGLDGVARVLASAVKRSIGSTTGCTITEKAPTRAFSWLKAPTSAFTFKTLC